MKKALFLIAFATATFSTLQAQTWTVGTPVNETIIDHPDSYPIPVDEYCYLLNAPNDQVAQYELALPPVSGINYYLVVDLAPTNQLDSFKFRQGTNVQILHLGDSMQLFPTLPFATIHLSYAGSTGYVSVKFKAIGTPLTAGENYPCGSTDDGWFNQPVQCMGRNIAAPSTYLTNCVVQSPTGLDEIDGRTEISIFPNPATETLNISFPDKLNSKQQIQIFNSMGMLLKEFETNQSTQINIANLPSGLYFIHPKNQSKQSQKFIKQ